MNPILIRVEHHLIQDLRTPNLILWRTIFSCLKDVRDAKLRKPNAAMITFAERYSYIVKQKGAQHE